MKKAAFFDRDGVLNKLVERDNGFYSPRVFSQFKIILNSIEVTNYTKSKGYLNIVISNQPDIARNLLPKTELEKMTNVLCNKLIIDDVFYCFHDDIDNCKCRKPRIGLFISAKSKWDIDFKNSFFIGDTEKDYNAAKKINIPFYLINYKHNSNLVNANRIMDISDIKNIIK